VEPLEVGDIYSFTCYSLVSLGQLGTK
jgi:hypothetical protein